MNTKVPTLVIALLTLIALGADPVRAQADRCAAAKLKAAGKKASSRSKCYAKGVSKGAPAVGTCLSNASGKLDAAFGKAEQKFTCHTNMDASTIEGDVDAFVDQVRSTVNGSAQGPSGCDAKKIQAAGKKASGKASCYSKQAAKGAPQVDADCITKAESKFSTAIGKAESGGDACTNMNQTMALEG